MDVLFFDLDNTLIDRATGFSAWAESFLRGRGRYSEDEVVWLHSEDGDGSVSRTSFFKRLREHYGLSEAVDDLVSTYRQGFPALIPPLSTPPADETLTSLRVAHENGFKICIVTNGSRGTQEPKIISSGLANHVDRWCISEDAGVRKPDPTILLIAAGLCGEELTPGSWLIGDRPQIDIWCAWRAGLRSAWITRGQDWDDALQYRPTLAASTVSDAVERIIAHVSAHG